LAELSTRKGWPRMLRYTTSPARYYPSEIWARLALEWVRLPYVLFHSVKMSHRLVRIRRAFLMRDRPVGPLRGPMNMVQADCDGRRKRLAYGGRLRQGLLMYWTTTKTEMTMRRVAESSALFRGRCLSTRECKKAAMRESVCVCGWGQESPRYIYLQTRWWGVPDKLGMISLRLIGFPPVEVLSEELERPAYAAPDDDPDSAPSPTR
jgi:hypothetical protein